MEGSSCSSGAAITTAELVGRIVGAVVLLILAALFSGLTLGVLGLDLSDLEIIKESGTEVEKRAASRIYPIRAQGNLLLCTLVLGNVAVTSLESILMADLTSGLIGFLLTTVLVVIFGEIVPQAFCARYGLEVGSKAAPLVNVIIFLFYPFTKPLALMLDCALGEEKGNSYNRAGLRKLVKMHVEARQLGEAEANIIQGALNYRSLPVKTIMTPLRNVFAVKCSDRLDAALMEKIFRKGYSRIPVWNEASTAVVGLLCALFAARISFPSPSHR